MNLLIVEDDPIQLSGLSYIIQKNYPDLTVYTSETYEDALSILEKCHIDMFFLDINLRGTRSGLDLCAHIRNISSYCDTPIIFITDITAPSLDVINRFHCRYYFSKPYQENDIIAAINSVTEYSAVTPEKIQLKDIQGILFPVIPSELIYVCASGHHKHIYTSHGDFIVTNTTFEALLTAESFPLVRCHRSYYFNPDYVHSYDKSNFIIRMRDTPNTVPVGRKYKALVDSYMESK